MSSQLLSWLPLDIYGPLYCPQGRFLFHWSPEARVADSLDTIRARGMLAASSSGAVELWVLDKNETFIGSKFYKYKQKTSCLQGPGLWHTRCQRKQRFLHQDPGPCSADGSESRPSSLWAGHLCCGLSPQGLHISFLLTIFHLLVTHIILNSI